MATYYVSSSPIRTGYHLWDDSMYVFERGRADSTTIDTKGQLYVDFGGRVTNTTVDPGGRLWVSSGGTATNTTVNSAGLMYVSSGGTANYTKVNSRGLLDVSSGGTANSTTVNSIGYLRILGGAASNTTVNFGGSLEVSSGGRANSTIINSAGLMYVSRYGMAYSTTVNSSGLMYVSSGGTAIYTTINSAGGVVVLSSGWANSTTVNSDGELYVSSGGKVTGELTISNGATVSAYAGSIIDFDIFDRTAESPALVNDLSLIQGTPAWTITVSADQATGTYTLADGANGFNRTFTIGTDGANYGTLTVNGRALTYGDYTYTLATSENSLKLTVEEGPALPEVLSVSADITTPTNQNVTVTATFSDDATIRQYSLNSTNWQAYTAGVVMEDNGSVYFRAGNDWGYSDAVSYEVTNIDKVPPEAPFAAADVTTPTEQNVTVTATFSEDSVQKQYSLDNKTWNNYTGGIVFNENGTVYFRGIDAAGNISDIASYTVNNITGSEPVPPPVLVPSVPTVSANITAITNQNVTVSAVFSTDATIKQYSLDNKNWSAYTSGIVMTANGTVYFRAGNENGYSAVASYTVSNIDKVAPVKPRASANITAATDQTVTVTATFSEDSAQKQYSLDGTNWSAYTSGIVFNANGTVYFRGIDAAGNISDTVSYTVTNIDKVAPVKPVASADITAPTDQTVTVTAEFSEDSAQKQYSLDNRNWEAYTDGVAFTQNGTVYFRGIDAVGNISETASYTVGNIAIISKGEGTNFSRVDVNLPGKYVLAGDFGDITGTVTVFSGLKKVGTGTLTNGVLSFNKGKPLLLDNSAGTFIQVAVKKGTNTNYTAALGATTLFDKGDTDSRETPRQLGNVAAPGTLVDDGWVGFGDEVDYLAFSLDNAANLSLDLTATDAAKFTLYNAATGKSVMNSSVKGAGMAALTTKPKLLKAGQYYLQVQSTNAKKGGDAEYTVGVNSGTKFFTKGDNSDDTYNTAKDLGPISNTGVLDTGWVGYGDTVDYKAITLDNAARLKFLVNATDAAKLTVYQDAGGKLKSLGTVSVKAGAWNNSKDILVTAGTYYLQVQSTNAKKGGDADYTVALDDSSRFFPAGDNSNDYWQAAAVNPAKLQGEEITGWVGYGDAKDFIKFQLNGNGQVQLDLDGATANAFNAKQIKLTCLDANGKSVALTAFDGDTLISKKAVAAGEYYLGVTCANVKKYDTSYSVTTGLLATA